LNTTGSLITVTGEQSTLTVNIPVALGDNSTLNSFTDASGVTFENNTLVLSTASSATGNNSLIQITDETGDLGTKLVIETGNAVGQGTKAVAEVQSITSNAGFTQKDLSSENSSLGTVASTVSLDLNTLPQNASVKITTSIQPDQTASSAFTLAATNAGISDISVAYTINIEKTNLVNNTDIKSADITMVVGRDWVEANGGTEAIRIIRYDPETSTQQVLETKFAGYDGQGRAVFEGVSTNGLSVFGLVAVKAAPTPTPTPAPTPTPTPTPTLTTTPTPTPTSTPTPTVTSTPTPALKGKSEGFPGWAIVLIVLTAIAVVGSLIYVLVIRKKRASA